MIFMSDEVTSDIIRKSHHKWPKIIIHSNSCIILYIRDVWAFCYEMNQMYGLFHCIVQVLHIIINVYATSSLWLDDSLWN